MKKRTYSKTRPTATRLKGSIWIPTDIKEETIDETTHYSFLNMEVADTGQDITNQEYLDNMESQFLHDRISDDYDSALAEGCPISLGFKIDCLPKNASDFHQTMSLLTLSGAESTVVRDYDNINHTLTVAEYKQLCIELGVFLMTKRQEKWAAIAEIGDN